MGSLCGSSPQMRLRWAVTLLVQLLLSHNAASSVGESGGGNARPTVPVSILSMVEEKDAATGHCGIIFHGATTAQPIAQNKQRQACFALQSYGFLTRYMRHEQNEIYSWGYDVCLLLAFCGSECHRHYGHPQKTPAAINALTEAEASIPGITANNQQDETGMSRFSGGERAPHRSTDGRAPQTEPPTEPPADSQQLSATNQREWGAVAPQGETTSLEVSDASNNQSFKMQKHCRTCARHFMSHAWRARCKGVYSLEFEAQNQGFGRFFARLALLLGAADIEEVLNIERELREYIRAKLERALKGYTSAVSLQGSGASQRPKESARPSKEVSKNAGPPDFPGRAKTSTDASYSSIDTSNLVHNELKIVLEPLMSNGDVIGSLDNAQLEKSLPTIQISIPSNFRARFGPITTPTSTMAHTRRLRGSSTRDSANSETWVGHKPFPAGSSLSSASHCKAAAAVISQRTELQWLKEYIFFLPHRG